MNYLYYILIEPFTQGFGSLLFVLFIIVVGFIIGIKVTTWPKRFVWIICWFLFSLFFAFATSEHPVQTLVYIIQLTLYFDGPLIAGGFFHKVIISSMRDTFRDWTDDQFLKHIESMLMSVIGVNHAWVKTNWHELPNNDKKAWITSNKSILIEKFPYVKNTIDMITLMQEINRSEQK